MRRLKGIPEPVSIYSHTSSISSGDNGGSGAGSDSGRGSGSGSGSSSGAVVTNDDGGDASEMSIQTIDFRKRMVSE